MLRAFGAICFLAAAFVGGYLAWIIWGTSTQTAKAQAVLEDQFQDYLEHPRPEGDPGLDLPGRAIARIIIPRMDLRMIVVNGTSTADLIKGPGLYEESPKPWEDHGRVAIAGHRTTYKAPFWDLNLLQPGDAITLETERGTFAYEVTDQRIVAPTDTQIARPNASKEPTLILTTCNPRFSASQRLIVIADRLDEV